MQRVAVQWAAQQLVQQLCQRRQLIPADLGREVLHPFADVALHPLARPSKLLLRLGDKVARTLEQVDSVADIQQQCSSDATDASADVESSEGSTWRPLW